MLLEIMVNQLKDKSIENALSRKLERIEIYEERFSTLLSNYNDVDDSIARSSMGSIFALGLSKETDFVIRSLVQCTCDL